MSMILVRRSARKGQRPGRTRPTGPGAATSMTDDDGQNGAYLVPTVSWEDGSTLFFAPSKSRSISPSASPKTVPSKRATAASSMPGVTCW